MRQFFLVFPREKLNAPRSESGVPAKWNALRSKSSSATKRDAPGLLPELSWTHYRLLLGVEDARARQWYMRGLRATTRPSA